jgi:hypothetical protein
MEVRFKLEKETKGALRYQEVDDKGQELRASNDAEIDLAFETVARQRLGALTVVAGPFFDTRRDKLVALATRSAVPTIYHFREFPAAGGLMSYGIDARLTYRQIGVYAGGILKGDRIARGQSRRLHRGDHARARLSDCFA